VSTPAPRENEGRAAAATPVSIPDFKNPRRFGLGEVLDLFVWSKVFELLFEYGRVIT
jgi:hypothetical protein